MLRIMQALLVVLLLSVLAACGTTGAVTINPDAPDTLGIAGWNPKDIDGTVNKLVQEMTSNEPLASRTDRPVVCFQGFTNRTNEHTDMKELISAFTIYGTKSGKMRFTVMQDLPDSFFEQHKFQKSAAADPATAAKFGKMVGWNYMLRGDLFSPVETMEVGRKKYHFYRAVVQLVNIETGIIEWTDEKKFVRYTERAVFGR